MAFLGASWAWHGHYLYAWAFFVNDKEEATALIRGFVQVGFGLEFIEVTADFLFKAGVRSSLQNATEHVLHICVSPEVDDVLTPDMKRLAEAVADQVLHSDSVVVVEYSTENAFIRELRRALSD